MWVAGRPSGEVEAWGARLAAGVKSHSVLPHRTIAPPRSIASYICLCPTVPSLPSPAPPCAATKWIHTLPFRPETMGAEAPEAMIYPEECKDAMHECPDWAKSGEDEWVLGLVWLG